MREHNSNNWNSIPEVYFISGQIKYIIQYKAGRVWYNKTVRLKSSAASWQYLWGYVHGYMARLQQRPNCLVAFRSTWGLKSHRTKNEYIRRLPPTSSQRGHVQRCFFSLFGRENGCPSCYDSDSLTKHDEGNEHKQTKKQRRIRIKINKLTLCPPTFNLTLTWQGIYM